MSNFNFFKNMCIKNCIKNSITIICLFFLYWSGICAMKNEQIKSVKAPLLLTISKELQSGASYKHERLLQTQQYREFRSFCPICNETSAQTCKGLADHLLTKHNNKKGDLYECTECQILFEHHEDVVMHLSKFHGYFYIFDKNLFHRFEDLRRYCNRNKLVLPTSELPNQKIDTSQWGYYLNLLSYRFQEINNMLEQLNTQNQQIAENKRATEKSNNFSTLGKKVQKRKFGEAFSDKNPNLIK